MTSSANILIVAILISAFSSRLSSSQSSNYINPVEKKILAVTYNVETNPASNIDLKSLLNLGADAKDLPDIVTVGFQELKFSAASSFKTSDYEKKLHEVLQARNYKLIDSVRLVGILLVAYVRGDTGLSNPSPTIIGNVEKSWVRTGFGGLFGNKGGVGLSMIINGKRLAIVNSHLPPNEGAVDDRVSAYNAITHGLTFDRHGRVLDHDYVLWFGDLNFRVQQFSSQEVIDAIGRNDLKRIFERDELTMIRNEGRAFTGFKEAEVNFAPTYKFYSNSNSNTYNLKRKPAWTDRILYRVKPNEPMLEASQTDYIGHFEFKSSDHRPVTSVIKINV